MDKSAQPRPYWSLPAADNLAQQGSAADTGLSAEEANARLRRFGPNLLTAKKSTSPWQIFINQLKSPIMLILIFATLVSAVVKDWVDALIILGIITASAVLSFAQEYSAGSAVEKLKEQVTFKASLLRGGEVQAVAAENVVPGDIILLSAGSLVPADAVVLEARDLFANQAVLTGETFPVEKKPQPAAPDAPLAKRENVLFMGTNIRSGSGKALVVETGSRTVFGQVAKRLTLRPPETDFERGIRRLGYLLTEVMLILVIGIFALNVYFHKPVLDSLLFSIALAVGLTPQLLPAIIEINLSKGARAMAAAGVIVRRLASIENFGSMNVLCTDKTGTLTEGVVRLDQALDASGEPSDMVRLYAFLNASLQTGMTNPLDDAITAGERPDTARFSKVDEIPYDFSRKRLTVVVSEKTAAGETHWMITKGALEGVLEICTAVAADGGKADLSAETRAAIHRRYEEWSGQGYRVLGVAVCQPPRQAAYTRDSEEGLAFAGFLLFFDPPKVGVKETIAGLKDLGIELKVITGDNRLVAEHAVRSLGVEAQGTLTGAEINRMQEEALWHAALKTSIFAEVDPNQKERIILALRKMGQVVGYIGDGVNDAPALHSADVSISVQNAVDVAREAADFVLLRPDLDVLRRGVVEGRRTFANTLKYIFMATSANFGNMFSVAGVSLLLPFLPMLPKQILLINLLTDLPEMTIAQDAVDEEMIRQPRRWDIGLIRRFMLVFGTLSSVFDFITFAVLMLVLHASEAQFRTGWFIESILSAVLVVFVLRTRLPFFHSRPARPMLLAAGLVCLAALAIPFTPLAALFEFTALPLLTLGVIAVIVALYIVSAEIAKRFFYRGR